MISEATNSPEARPDPMHRDTYGLVLGAPLGTTESKPTLIRLFPIFDRNQEVYVNYQPLPKFFSKLLVQSLGVAENKPR